MQRFSRNVAIFLILMVIAWSLPLLVKATLSPADRGKGKKKETQVAERNVVDRNLVSITPKLKDIVNEHSLYFEKEKDKKQFEGETLAYVTPWNNHGYDVAKIFGAKFSYVSPVWLQVKRRPSGVFYIQGTHDIDKGWVSDVIRGRRTSLMPRVLFDGWSKDDFTSMFASEDEMEDCALAIRKVVKENRWSGAVIEIWSQLGGEKRSDLVHFISHLGELFREAKKQLILVIPPPLYAKGYPGLISQSDVAQLAESVDRFSLMTYDYTHPTKPGPNSPLSWVRDCVLNLAPNADSPIRKKLLVGMNLYGLQYKQGGHGEHILGSQYIEILKKTKASVRWNKDHEEHIVDFRHSDLNYMMYYPTLKSIQARLDLAKELGTGVSLWEVGQGLDYFYDLF